MSTDVDKRIEIHVGDITAVVCDAIVNAANAALRPGGGVCGAIHRAAGPELAEACAEIGGCPTGEARHTAAFRLPARLVIHTVGPVWQGGDSHEHSLLASCYRGSLKIAAEQGARSIAFPAISTGVYGFPLVAATRVAVDSVRRILAEEPRLERVIFCVFGEEARRVYEAELDRGGPG